MSALHLVATIAGQSVALSADQVESVVVLSDVVPVPGSAAVVAGIVALRSRVATVIDPARLVADEGDPAGRAIITRVDGHLYAICVDAVEEVADAGVEPLPAGLVLHAPWRDLAQGLLTHGGEPALLIDLARLVTSLTAAPSRG